MQSMELSDFPIFSVRQTLTSLQHVLYIRSISLVLGTRNKNHTGTKSTAKITSIQDHFSQPTIHLTYNMSSTATEICRPAWTDQPEPLVSYGLPFSEATRKHVDETFKASRVYVIASASLARNTLNLQDLENALGKKLAGVRIGMKPHSFMSEILEVIHDVQRVDADLIVTLGGGSLTDAAKLIAFVSRLSPVEQLCAVSWTDS